MFKRYRSIIIACMLAIALFPTMAYADYVIPSVNTTAQVQTDGSLHVVEQRAFDMDEEYVALKWNFTGLPSDSETIVSSVRVAPVGQDGVVAEDWMALLPVPFQSSWRDALGHGLSLNAEEAQEIAESSLEEDSIDPVVFPEEAVWSFDERWGCLYIFYPFAGQILVECDYTATNAVFVYDDVAELYWDYISPNSEAEIENVEVTVQLPIPDAMQLTAVDHIYAWGHGPDGTVDISESGTVTYRVISASPDQYAQAHMIFPASWLKNLPEDMQQAYTGVRKDAAIAEEGRWSDTWSVQRINQFIIQIVATACAIVMIIAALILYLLFARPSKEQRIEEAKCTNKEDLANKLFAYPAALIGRACHWDREYMDDLIATLMDMQRKGILSISAARSLKADDLNSVLPKDESTDLNFTIRLTPKAKEKEISPIEKETLHLLFDTITDGYQMLEFKDILDFATNNPDEYADAMKRWQSVLSSSVSEQDIFDSRTRRAFRAVIGLFIASLILCAVGYFFMKDNYVALVFLASAIVIGFIANYTAKRTPKGSCIEDNAIQLMDGLADLTWLEKLSAMPYVYAISHDLNDIEEDREESAAGDDSGSEDALTPEEIWLQRSTLIGNRKTDALAVRATQQLQRALVDAYK